MPDPNNGSLTGADRINHAQAFAQARRAGGQASGIVTGGHGGPLFGLGSATEEIIRASGLGRRTPDEKSRGEKMSDADPAKQDVQVDDDGGSVHRRASQNGIQEVSIGRGPYMDEMAKYPSFVHRHMPTSLAELQSNLAI